MLEPNVVQKRLHVLWRDLAIARCHIQQLAACKSLRGSTLINVDVCCLGANNSVIRLGRGLQSEDICSRAAEHEKYLGLFAKVLAKQRDGTIGVRIIAIGNNVAVIRGADRL